MLLLLLPLTRVLALDYVAMSRNLVGGEYQSLPISEAWHSWGVAALRLGALPLSLLLLAGALSRLRVQWRPGAWTLGAVSRRLRLGLAALALVPLALFCLPFALALTTWLLVEVFWWIQWYGNREPIQWAILAIGLPLFTVGTMVFGVWGAGWALHGPRSRPAGKRPWGRKVLMVLLAVALLIPALTTGAALAARTSRVIGSLGSAPLFQDKCGGCHPATRVLEIVKTPDEWEHLVRRERQREKLPLTDAEQAEVVGFLQAMRSFPDSWTFRTRCQRCHMTSSLSWQDRHPDDWAMIVDRVGRYSPHYYPPAVRRQLKRHLAAAHGDQEQGPGISGARYQEVREVVEVCSRCHFVSREAEAQQGLSEAGAEALVRRMSRKMVNPIPEQRIKRLARAYRLVIDPANLDRLAPHHRPRRGGDLPW